MGAPARDHGPAGINYTLQDVIRRHTRKSIPADFLSATPTSVRDTITVSNSAALAAVDPDDGAYWVAEPVDPHGRPVTLATSDDWARLINAMMLLAGTEAGTSSDLAVSMGVVAGDNFHNATTPCLGFSVRWTGGGRRVVASYRASTGTWTHSAVIANANCRGVIGVVTQYGADIGLVVASEVEASGKKSTAGAIRATGTTSGIEFSTRPYLWYAVHTLATTATGSLQIDDWAGVALGGVG